jgi:hypothetical protein
MSMDESQAPEEAESDDEDVTEPLDALPALKGGGTAGGILGAAMFGLEAALRREPPAQVRVKETQPQRGLSGSNDDLVIEFPDTSDDTE